MNRILTTSLVFLFLTTLLTAQKANPVFFTDTHITGEARMCNSNAGTIQSFGPFIGQSNDIMGDTIFLCMGDSIFIDHANDEDLSGDPNMVTPAGIGYAFFNCPPTSSGPMVSDISSDGCTTNIGNPPFGFYVYTGGVLNGDVFFFNDGNLQMALNGGNPGIYYFAPITFDELNIIGLAGYEGNPVGDCVHLSTNEAFAVAYLNEVSMSTPSISGCSGSFSVEGGLPELQGNTSYTVNIFKQDTPAIVASINTPVGHGDVVNFTAPEPGLYVIEVEDGKSCGTSTTVMIETCDFLLFDFPLTNTLPGSNECIPVRVNNFTNLLSAQGTISWDPSILTITGLQGFHPSVPDLNVGSFAYFPIAATLNPGLLTYAWNDFSQLGVTLPDGDILFEICFDVVGQLGECSPLGIETESPPTIIEVINLNSQEIDLQFNLGVICISEDPFFTLIEQDSLTCPSFDDGTFTVTVDEGVAPYSFSWNTVPLSGPNNTPPVVGVNGGSITVSDLSAGVYQITITDSSNPIALEIIDTFEVFAGPVLGITIRDTVPSCFSVNDGSLRFLPTSDGFPLENPGPDYSFVWSVPNGVINPGNTNYINNVPSGSYGITVTDPAGCQEIALIPLGQPPAIRVLEMNTFIMDASCTGGGDGEISITAIGGTSMDGTYNYEWNTGLIIQATTSTLASLNPGEYCVTVTDDNGCTEEECFTVGATKVLSINGPITDVTCSGFTNGLIFITGSTTGAIAEEPYSFTWSTNAPAPSNTTTTSELMNIGAGTYYITMTDNGIAGCEVIDSFTVVEPTPLIPNIFDFTNETCIVGNDGSITLQVEGGTYPYTYSWPHDPLLMDSIALNLSEGNYIIDITDTNGCMQQLTQMVSAPSPPLIINLFDASVTCANDLDGQLLVNVSAAPGTIITNFEWSTGQMGTNLNSINTLGPGEYIVTVTADNQCTTIDTAMVNAPDPITLDDLQVQMPDCPSPQPGFNNGQISVVPVGGVTPYTFSWSNGATNPFVLAGLEAGTYQLTITDSNLCESEEFNIVVAAPPSIIANFTNQMDTSCPMDDTCDGQLTATVFYSDGTTGDFNFQWGSGENSSGGNTATAVQLCEGPQSVVIGDGVCGIDTSFTIMAPEPIDAETVRGAISCNGGMDGSLMVIPSGGTSPYNILWLASGNTTNSIDNLSANTYSVVIRDGNNCTFQQNLIVAEPNLLTLSIDATQTTDFVTCAGDMDGIISVIATGGNPTPDQPYSFVWNNSSTQSIISNLDAGSYSVSVVDYKDCMAELSFTILEPLPIEFTIDPIIAPLCFGDATLITIDTVFGGAGNAFEEYTFMIDNNGLNFPVIQPATVFAGDHIVTVEDINGCMEEQNVSILSPAQLNIDLPSMLTVELGDSTMQLLPIISPSGNYTYLWTPADFLSNDTIRNPFVFPANSLDYTLTIVNEFGCTTSESIFVELDANRNVYIPNIFSPNGDGINDKFQIFACTGVKQVSSVQLFDRWGGLLYEDADIAPNCLGVNLWDGRKRNKTLPSGVYVYIIEVEFLDNVVLTYRGDVAIIR